MGGKEKYIEMFNMKTVLHHKRYYPFQGYLDWSLATLCPRP